MAPPRESETVTHYQGDTVHFHVVLIDEPNVFRIHEQACTQIQVHVAILGRGSGLDLADADTSSLADGKPQIT